MLSEWAPKCGQAGCRRTAISCCLVAVSTCPHFLRLPLREPVFQLKNIVLAEYYDGKADKMRCYNDVFMYSPRRESWMQVISPGGCGPSAHA